MAERLAALVNKGVGLGTLALGFFVGIPVIGGIGMSAFQRWLQHKERMSQLIASETAEKAAQYAAHVERIEARLRVVEEIVTDGGAQTAAQIEALREAPRSRNSQTTSRLDVQGRRHDIYNPMRGEGVQLE